MAAPVQGHITASADTVDDPMSVISGIIDANDSFELFFVYRPDVTDSSPDVSLGEYLFGPQEARLQLQVPGWKPEVAGMQLTMWNDSALGDRWILEAADLRDPNLPNLAIDLMIVEMIDLYGGMITFEPVLPSCPPALDSWAYMATVWLSGHDEDTGDGFSVYASITATGGSGQPQIEYALLRPLGQPSDFTFGCVTPGDAVHGVVGTAGSTLVPNCGTLTVPVANPVLLGSDTANSRGKAAVSRVLPAAAYGSTWTLAAAELTTCRASEPYLITP